MYDSQEDIDAAAARIIEEVAILSGERLQSELDAEAARIIATAEARPETIPSPASEVVDETQKVLQALEALRLIESAEGTGAPVVKEIAVSSDSGPFGEWDK
jgi:hypothetical protein